MVEAALERTIDEVNELDEDGFVAAFGHVFEATPALAAAAWAQRPFADRAALVAAFEAAANGLDPDAALVLLRAHPQLAAAGPMTADSAREQHGAGLTSLDIDTRMRITDANARYVERFGFPFVIAVRGLGPDDIAAALDERLTHGEAQERVTALAEVRRIAELRIEQAVSG